LRIIAESTLAAFAVQYPKAATGLEGWRRVMRQEQFGHFADLRRCFRSADQVRAGSDKPVVVFNICGNTYRLVCAIQLQYGQSVPPPLSDARGI
jgi:mRNA interferase HigB